MKGIWVVQLNEHHAIGFCSGRDLRAVGLCPALGSVLSVESAWTSLLPCPLPSSPTFGHVQVCAHILSNKQIDP